MKTKICLTTTLFLILCSLFTYAQDPFYFVENKAQWDVEFKFGLMQGNKRIFFKDNAFLLTTVSQRDIDKIGHLHPEDFRSGKDIPVHGYTYEMEFLGGGGEIRGLDKQKYYQNYFIGSDSTKWAGFVGTYKGIEYVDLYDGINIKAYTNEKGFKYDYHIQPNVDLGKLQFRYNGIQPVLTNSGTLLFDLGFEQLEESIPESYQIVQGKKVKVDVQYVQYSDSVFGFAVLGNYNPDHELIIDPYLVFGTWNGAVSEVWGGGSAYDPTNGNYFSYGIMQSLNAWPVTPGAFITNGLLGADIGINLFDPLGTSLIFSTYLGASSGSEHAWDLIVDQNNELIIFGSTSSTLFPVTANAYDLTYNSQDDFFVTRFNATGSALIGSTYIGGNQNEIANSYGQVRILSNGNIAFVGLTLSANYPVSGNAFQSNNNGDYDAVITILSGDCSSLIASSYLGGAGYDRLFSLSEKSNGNIVVGGGTASVDLPVSLNAAYPVYQGGTEDGFLAEFNSDLSILNNCTYYGGSDYDIIEGVEIVLGDTVIVCGASKSYLPATPGAYSVLPNGNAFITKFSPDLSYVSRVAKIFDNSFPTFIANAFYIDSCSNIIFVGHDVNYAIKYPTTSGADTVPKGYWICVLTDNLSNLHYATYFGVGPMIGGHVDFARNSISPNYELYLNFCLTAGGSTTIPTTPGSLYTLPSYIGQNVASFKLNLADIFQNDASFSLTTNDSGCVPFTISPVNTSQGYVSYFWDFGDGFTSTDTFPTHTYTTKGLYNLTLVTTNPANCNRTDTFSVPIYVDEISAAFDYELLLGCDFDTVTFYNLDSSNNAPGTSYLWNFGDANIGTIVNPSHIYGNQGVYNVTCRAYNSFCSDTVSRIIDLNHPIDAAFSITHISAPPEDSICLGEEFIITDASIPQGYISYLWDFGDGNTSNAPPVLAPYTYTKGGLFDIKLFITDTLGCVDSAVKRIFVEPAPFATFNVSPLELCVGESVFIQDSIAPHTLNWSYDFGDGFVAQNGHNPIHLYDVPGVYNIVLNADYVVCPYVSESISVRVRDYPVVNLGPDTAYCPDVSSPITLANLANPFSILKWNTGENAASIQVNRDGYYWAEARNGNCTSSDSLWVRRDCFINIPNSFSPNGDGLNDYFLPRQLLSSGLIDFKMSIYNRWGELIFSTRNIEGRGWDGRYGDKPQPVGTYVYLIEAQFRNGIKKSFSGNVSLLR